MRIIWEIFEILHHFLDLQISYTLPHKAKIEDVFTNLRSLNTMVMFTFFPEKVNAIFKALPINAHAHFTKSWVNHTLQL